MAEVLRFNREWTLGDRLDGGGFGEVYLGFADGDEAAVKLIPKQPGAERELLFVDLGDVRNVVPILDSGESDDHWGLVMPLASQNLRAEMSSPAGRLSQGEALSILQDIVAALVDLDGSVVHRDLKPENVLLLDDSWCLADFGIARYAEATTAPRTRKFALTPAYSAPERWRGERADGSADVYSFGVMAFEMLAGHLPFAGPSYEDFREQHLHDAPAELDPAVPPPLAALVTECLYKAPGARPAPANIAARLEALTGAQVGGGLAALEEANRLEVERRAEVERTASIARSAEKRREDLASAGLAAFEGLSNSLRGGIVGAASSATVVGDGKGWKLSLGPATLTIESPNRVSPTAFEGTSPIDVILECELRLAFPPDRFESEGRSHSLWFADAMEEGRYGWFETAFMLSPLSGKDSRVKPFALAPANEAGIALSPALHTVQVAWPFTELNASTIDEFVGRWAGWLAEAVAGTYSVLSMPERNVGSWRM